jgi:ParB family transcriptional regulator, chromosome partitioning protein
MKKGLNKGLGKGLDALLASSSTEEEQNSVLDLSVHAIDPGDEQPRKQFDQDKLEALASSIRTHGVVQPVIVRKQGDRYTLVAGERRWRASRLAGLKSIPAIVKDYSSRDVMEIALIENLQREDLNPIEEGEAFQRLMDDYGLTQEEVANVVGRSRSAVANTVRMLTLPQKIRGFLIDGRLTSGHARTLVSINDEDIQEKLAEQIISKELNVREAEQLVKRLDAMGSRKPKREKDGNVETAMTDLQDRLRSLLGTQVEITGSANRGKIQITYFSSDDLDRLCEILLK